MCWTESKYPAYFWIIRGPITASIIANFVLFLNIMRMIFMKMFSPQSPRHWRYRKWFRSTLVLLPLFGVHYTITTITSTAVKHDKSAELSWLMVDQEFSSFQGFVVALLYCFANSEVRGALWDVWLKWKTSCYRLAGFGKRMEIPPEGRNSQDELNSTAAINSKHHVLQRCQYCAQKKNDIDSCKSQDTVLSFMDLENKEMEELQPVVEYVEGSIFEVSAIIDTNQHPSSSASGSVVLLEQPITSEQQTSNLLFLPKIVFCSPNVNQNIEANSNNCTKDNNFTSKNCNIHELRNRTENLASHLTNNAMVSIQEQSFSNLNVVSNFYCYCNKIAIQSSSEHRCNTCKYDNSNNGSPSTTIDVEVHGNQCSCENDLQRHKQQNSQLVLNYSDKENNQDTIAKSQQELQSNCVSQRCGSLECLQRDTRFVRFNCKSDHQQHITLTNIKSDNHDKKCIDCENLVHHARELGDTGVNSKDNATEEDTLQNNKLLSSNTESYRPRSRSDGSKWFNKIKKPPRTQVKPTEWVEMQEKPEENVSKPEKSPNAVSCSHQKVELGLATVIQEGNVFILNTNMNVNKCRSVVQKEIECTKLLAVHNENTAILYYRPRSKSECIRKPGGFRNRSNQSSPRIPEEWMKPKEDGHEKRSEYQGEVLNIPKKEHQLVDIIQASHLIDSNDSGGAGISSMQKDSTLDSVIEEKVAEIVESQIPTIIIDVLSGNQLLEEPLCNTETLMEKHGSTSYETPLLTDSK